MRLAAGCLAVLLIAPPAAPVSRVETKHLIVATSQQAKPGPDRRLSLFIDVTPKPGMHVYAPGQTEYIPISLTMAHDARLVFRATRLPRAEKYFFKPLEKIQLVYSKPFRIVQEVSVTPGTAAVTLTGTLRYQACDDAMCYMPVSVPLTWTN